jgi:hypothetical protein
LIYGLGKAANLHLLALNLCNADGIYSKRIEDYIKTENPQAVRPILLTARDQKYELQYYQILDLIEFVVGGMSTGICPDEIQARYTSRNSFEDPEKQNQYLWLPENIWNK